MAFVTQRIKLLKIHILVDPLYSYKLLAGGQCQSTLDEITTELLAVI